jgi:hypothetical protein
VKAELGSGQSLQGGVQSRMSAAFGYDFSGVRVHTDAKAGELSSQLNARAFTIGSDVAFAGGEYQPGTLIGDALIAHELAHVVQQSDGISASIPQRKSEGNDNLLEKDADRAVVGVVMSQLSAGSKSSSTLAPRLAATLRSGLRLQRCKSTGDSPTSGTLSKVTVGHFRNTGSTADSGENNCANCPRKLGLWENSGHNGMEVRGDIDGHRPDAQYDFKRTKERATWKKVGATWTQVSHVGPGEDDDKTDDDESLTPVNNHIYSEDIPGFEGLNDPLGDAAATEEVYKASFVESVNVKVGSGSWAKNSNDFLWHSITWLEKVAGQWRRKPGANEIEAGATNVGTGDP